MATKWPSLHSPCLVSLKINILVQNKLNTFLWLLCVQCIGYIDWYQKNYYLRKLGLNDYAFDCLNVSILLVGTSLDTNNP